MRKLFLILYRFRAFFFFLLLEAICLIIITWNNSYQNVSAMNSSNVIAARTMALIGKIGEYIDQPQRLRDLSEKYAELQTELQEYKQREKQYFLSHLDESKIYQYKYIPAKVVNNNLYRINNYITIDKGTEQGVEPGMGIISPNGIVGVVKSCSDNFSTVRSFLHTKTSVSARVKRNNALCVAKWKGEGPRIASIDDIPRHVSLYNGDTIVTSGFNAIYPEGVMIGKINNHKLEGDDSFYRATARLSTDFSRVSYVFVVTNRLKLERKEMEEKQNENKH